MQPHRVTQTLTLRQIHVDQESCVQLSAVLHLQVLHLLILGDRDKHW